MPHARGFRSVVLLLPFLLSACATNSGQPPAAPPAHRPAGTWYFAVSGDSRDCGDVIMPKIAQSIAGLQAKTPVSFYWHLGDFRRGKPDCDIVKRTQPDWDCANRKEDQVSVDTRNAYPSTAWDDFIKEQVRPFGVPVYLAIGNHELYGQGWTPDAVRGKFREWLTQDAIQRRRAQEAQRQITSPEGATYYDFVQNGVDFITLDNSELDHGFSPEQLAWLRNVLAYAETDPEIKTIVAGMHAALPYSHARSHAMDMNCVGICSGSQAYDLLEHAKSRGKNVYVFASHSHRFEEHIFKEEKEHAGHVLDGWVVGTAGAQQYRADNESIQYGYALVEVHPDGKLTLSFREVKSTDPPVKTGTGETELAGYCFTQNKRGLPNDATQETCHCESASP